MTTPISRRRVLAGLAGLGAAGATSACRSASVRPAMPASSAPRVTATESPVTPAPPPETVAATLGIPLLCRDAWGAVAPRSTDAHHVPIRLTLHHTAVVLDDNRKAPARLRQHQRYHLDNGFSDIAYHVGIDRNGNAYELRDPAVPGETFTNYDPTGHFLVVAEGNFETEFPSDAQLEGVAQVLAGAGRDHGLSLDTMAAHRDHDPTTSCPGDHLYARLSDLRARAIEILTEADPTLEIWCDDPAFARVDAIERGEA